MVEFELLHPAATHEHLGFIPAFLSLDDPRSAQEQLDASYKQFGGFNVFRGFRLGENNALHYPGDPPMNPVAQVRIRHELVTFYLPGAWVAVIQPDRSYVVARMD